MRFPRRRFPAFTLVEVLISIGIFVLLAGGIFASVQAAFSATDQVSRSQLASERAAAFQQVIRRFFTSLPGEAQVELRLRKLAGRGDVVELLAWPVPAFLRFGSDTRDGLAVTALPDGRGNFRLSLGFFDANASPDERERQLAATPWLTLLPDVKEIRWRFAPPRNPVLTDIWTTANGRPGLAELTLAMADGSGGTFAYSVPVVQRRVSGPGLDSTAPPPGAPGAPGQPPPPGGRPDAEPPAEAPDAEEVETP